MIRPLRIPTPRPCFILVPEALRWRTAETIATRDGLELKPISFPEADRPMPRVFLPVMHRPVRPLFLREGPTPFHAPLSIETLAFDARLYREDRKLTPRERRVEARQRIHGRRRALPVPSSAVGELLCFLPEGSGANLDELVADLCAGRSAPIFYP